MNEDRHARLSELYLQACELDLEERDAFIAESCADHPSLEDELRRMVQPHDDLPEILHTGSMDRSLNSSDVPIPQTIGPYRVTELLGEGGMGIVYRAMQETPIRREVAVKLIKLGIETESVVQRFESERQTLALMDHPNIARVIDAGTTEYGRSYFAMEYVSGVPITQFCDARRLTIRERLELLEKVCDGVQHAHHNGVIHRDIKPSNILVTTLDGKIVPKIIDFGVSKALDRGAAQRTMFTEMGQFVGTPEYMSPEQTEPDSRNVDTRTDVYALGVLLYELATGALPFDPRQLRKSDFGELQRRIREEDPRAPSTRVRGGRAVVQLARNRNSDPASLSRRLRGDIDWIVMKALEKDRGRRYGSPAELAADVRRHIEHEPVLASPPSPIYRTRKFIRKNRIAVGFVSVLAIGSAIFAVAMVVQANRIAREQHRAAQEAETAATISTYLEDLFDVTPRTDFRGMPMDPARFFDQGIEQIPTLENQPFLHATLLRSFGALQSAFGRPQKAIPLLERASQQLEVLRGNEDAATLTVNHHLAVAYGQLERFDEALALFDRVAASRGRVLGPDHPNSLSTRLEQGFVLKMAKRNDEAEGTFASVLEGMRRLHGETNPITLICAGFLASIYLEQQRHDEVEALLSPIVGTMREMLGEHHVEYRAAQYNLAAAALAAGDEDRALALLEQLPGGPPTDPGVDPHFKALWDDPRLDAIAHRVQLALPYPRERHRLEIERLWTLGRLDEAERMATELFHANRVNLGIDHPETENATASLSWLYIEQGRCDQARPLLEKELDRQRSRLGAGTWQESDTLQYLSYCEIADGRISEATALLARARVIPRDTIAMQRIEAEYRALIGDLDGALKYARLTIQDSSFESWLRGNLAFRRYANDPKFEAFVAEASDRVSGDSHE